MSGQLIVIAELEAEAAELRGAISGIIDARDAEDFDALLAAMDRAAAVAAKSAMRAATAQGGTQ